MRSIPTIVAALAFSTVPATVSAQHGATGSGGAADAAIASALSAAPPSVAAGARVMLMDGTVLRQGTNGWTCIPDDASVPNDSPMCLDATWLAFFDAYMNRRDPAGGGVGIAYMLQGDMPVSNVDPFASGPTPENQWLQDAGPHIMVIVPDTRLLDTLTADPHNGGPWVMWRGTPYAHVMIPTVPRRK